MVTDFAEYEDCAKVVSRVARSFVRRYPFLDPEELFQEGVLYAWEELVPVFDRNQSSFDAWIKRGTVWKFNKLARERLAARRSENNTVLVGSLSEKMTMGVLVRDGRCYDFVPAFLDDEARARKIRSKLSMSHQRVFDVYMDPPPELAALARNLTGDYKWTQNHLAMYLGISLRTVEYALDAIREQLEAQ